MKIKRRILPFVLTAAAFLMIVLIIIFSVWVWYEATGGRL